MPLYVNTNVASLNAQRQLGSSGMQLDQAAERLSSGKRINSAADDAAGLAISNRQTSQIRGLDQAVRNANDGISLIQTAEGALDETTNILQRMRELAIQSANGIYGDSDRATLDAEVQQLVAELDRIATSTSFNGQNILDGTQGKVELQVGSQANQTIDFEIQAVDSKTLGMGSLSADVVGGEIAPAINSQSALKEQDVLINGQAVGAWGSSDTLKVLIDNINENVNGVTASTVVELNASNVGTGITGSTGSTFTLTKLDGLTLAFTVSNTDNLQEFADGIIEESGGIVSATIDDLGRLQLSAQDALSLGIGAAGTSGLGDDTDRAKIVLTSDDGNGITVQRGATGTLDQLDRIGFRETRVAGQINGANLTNSSSSANEKLDVGELTINGVAIGVTDTSSLTGKIDAINDATSQTGVTAKAFASAVIDFTGYISSNVTATLDQVEINGVTLDLGLAISATASDIATAINSGTTQTGVTARVLGTDIVLESDQGSIQINTLSGAVNLFGTSTGLQQIRQTLASSDNTIVVSTTTLASSGTENLTLQAGLQLTSTNGNPISIELSNDSELGRLGLKNANSLGEGSFGTALSSISVDTASNAQKAIGVIDNALNTVNDIRSDLGAANNRLDFTISNLSNVSENASAARSRIVDADFAAETAALSRAQVLQQASQAMLAQANARPQQVLSLLQ